MNKVAFISDIHGNLPALEAVLKDIRKENISQIYCLGDLVGYYCYFNEVIDLLIKEEIPSIIGNHDFALVKNNGVIDTSKTCTKILKWQLERAKPSSLSFLKNLSTSLSFDFGGKSFLCVHGGLVDYTNEYLFGISEEYFKSNSFDKDVLVSGHTHLSSFLRFFSGESWLNPGSVGQSRDGNPDASYVVIDELMNVNFKRVKYDFNKVISKMKEFGFEDYISKGLSNGIKIGV